MKKVTFINFLFLCLVLSSAGLYAQPDTVKLYTPANKAAGISIETALTWLADSGAAGYRLQIATANTFLPGNIVFEDSSIAGLTKTLLLPSERLENSKQYFWRVQAKDTSGKWGEYSLIWTFYTVSAVTPSLLFPVGGVSILTKSVTLSWNSDPYLSGVKYDVYYSKSLSAGQLNAPITLAANITAITKNFATLEAGTTYYWQVRSKTSAGVVCSYSAIDSFATSEAIGAVVPVAGWPVGGAIVSTTTPTVYYYINTLNPGLKFNVYYSTIPGFVIDGSTPNTGWKTAMYAKLPALTAGGHYYWKIRSRLISDPTKVSDPSEVADFIVDSALAKSAQVPVQAWPIGGATIYTTSVRFSWYLNSYVTGLKYMVKYKELPSGSEITSYWTNNSYLTVPDLTPGKEYQWWVKSSADTVGDLTGSGWSMAETFAIDSGIVPTAVVPVLAWPVGDATVYSTTPTLYWYTLAGAAGLEYEVQYSTDSGFPADITKTKTLGPTSESKISIVTPLTAGTTYYWRVHSKVGAGSYGDFSEAESFTVDAPAPVEALQPLVSSPSDGALVTSIPVKLIWYIPGSSAGLKYHLKVSNYPFDEAYLIVDTDTLTKMEYTATGLAPGATYAWQVYSYEAENPSNASAPSDVSTFTVSAGASGSFVPFTGSPAGGVKISTANPVLTWFLPSSNKSSKYELQYSLNKNMSSPQSLTNISSTSKALNGLNAGSTYYWRVRSVNSDGKPSAFSNVESFIAASVTGVGKNDNSSVPAKFDVAQNYPNPFNPSTTIKVSLPASSLLTVKVYNMLGQEVKTLMNSQASAGVHSIVWHGEDNSGNILPSGSYIYRVTAGGNVTTGKMMFLK